MRRNIRKNLVNEFQLMTDCLG